MQQISGFVGKLRPWQKIMLFALPIIVFASIVLMVALSTSGSKSDNMAVLFSDLTPQDASQIIDNLTAQKIDYELKENGTTILVDQKIVDKTRLRLASDGLPATSVVGYELFDKTNLGMSEFVQKVNFRRALEGELAKTIGALEEVKKVRVHLVMPEKALFKVDEKDPSASVTLHMKPGHNLNKISIQGVQTLVASSVEGLQPGSVTVTDNRGRLLSETVLDEHSVAGMTAQQHDQQRKVEKHLEDKAQRMLDNALGVGKSRIQVTAELDFTQIEEKKTEFDPESQVIRSEQQILEKSESTDSLSYPAVNMQRDESNNIQNYEISKTEEHIVHEVGGIKRLSIAAMVDGKYNVITNEKGIKSVEYVARPKEEIEQLEEVLKNAVGFNSERNDQISVVNVQFDTSFEEYQDTDLNPIPFWQRPENIRLFALIIVMMIALFLMWRLVQSKYVKENIRVALELPRKPSMELTKEDFEDDEEEEQPIEDLEDLELDEDDLLLLPAELPEQLLLEGESLEDDEPEQIEGSSEGLRKEDLAERAKAAFEDAEIGDLDEHDLMKIEIKNKVEQYADDQTEDTVRLIRVFMQQDSDMRF